MARKPRLEYAGAVYHVMNRGNRRQAIFRADGDRECFLEALGEVCGRTGWKVHAYVLMGNHYHLLLETPEPNLTAGMQWLQGTYTKRFNAAHREWGHLFQGRYKAIPVESGGEYFLAVATYIHLNPVRMKGYDFDKARLEDYAWSSYPGYVQKRKRGSWLCVDRVLAALHLSDTSAGRTHFGAYMMKRALEIRHAEKPWEADEQWKRIRRGWYFGGDGFRDRMMEGIENIVIHDKGTAFGGGCIQEHNERQANRLLIKGLEALRLREADLPPMRKSSPEKRALAWLIRKRTSVKTGWIKRRLHMGTATNFSELLNKLEDGRPGTPGHEELRKLRSIKI
ncbi:MAG: transposase [Kiritimatiellia bacterium]